VAVNPLEIGPGFEGAAGVDRGGHVAGVLEVHRRGGELQIVVTDSGPGLTAAVREKLFTPFFTTKPVGKGTGIGLSVSRSLIESHGGTLELDAAHENTRFVIHLPAAQDTQKAG